MTLSGPLLKVKTEIEWELDNLEITRASYDIDMDRLCNSKQMLDNQVK